MIYREVDPLFISQGTWDVQIMSETQLWTVQLMTDSNESQA